VTTIVHNRPATVESVYSSARSTRSRWPGVASSSDSLALVIWPNHRPDEAGDRHRLAVAVEYLGGAVGRLLERRNVGLKTVVRLLCSRLSRLRAFGHGGVPSATAHVGALCTPDRQRAERNSVGRTARLKR